MITPVPSNPQRTARAKPPRVPVLAVAALVLALVPCCPFVSLLGGVLGYIAWRKIQAAQGRLGGRRIALAATVIGFAFSAIASIALTSIATRLDRHAQESMNQQVQGFFADLAADRFTEARDRWHPEFAAQLTDDVLHAFAQQVHERHGRFERFHSASSISTGSLLMPRLQVAAVFTFSTGQVTGMVEFDMSSAASMFWPEFQLRALGIDHAERGQLQLPPP